MRGTNGIRRDSGASNEGGANPRRPIGGGEFFALGKHARAGLARPGSRRTRISLFPKKRSNAFLNEVSAAFPIAAAGSRTRPVRARGAGRPPVLRRVLLVLLARGRRSLDARERDPARSLRARGPSRPGSRAFASRSRRADGVAGALTRREGGTRRSRAAFAAGSERPRGAEISQHATTSAKSHILSAPNIDQKREQTTFGGVDPNERRCERWMGGRFNSSSVGFAETARCDWPAFARCHLVPSPRVRQRDVAVALGFPLPASPHPRRADAAPSRRAQRRARARRRSSRPARTRLSAARDRVDPPNRPEERPVERARF